MDISEEVKQQQKYRAADEANTAKRASLLQIAYLDTRTFQLNNGIILNVMPLNEMYLYKIIPLKNEGESYIFGVTINTPQSYLRLLREKFHEKRVDVVMISDSGFKDIMKVYDPPKQVNYEDIEIVNSGHSKNIEQISTVLEGIKSDDILWYLIGQAYKYGTSDIHLECARDFVRIRFRLNGMLHDIAHITHQKYYQLQQSIAVKAGISTSALDAQTGHLTERVTNTKTGENEILNMRIETVPTLYGQDAVLRLFNFDTKLLNLNHLGLNNEQLKPIQDVITHPHGMVLVVGPTGSGKTTTLYSILSSLNTSDKKIMTLEDPVEYGIDGMTQIPVDTRAGDSFANKLRSVLRLDPDVIMVGEIRDKDTAQTSMQAAVTGHLVLSTFHANSTVAAMGRMLDLIGTNPIFASALKLIIAQRLVRRLDDATKIAYKPDDSIIRHIKESLAGVKPEMLTGLNLDNITLYKPGSSKEFPFGFTTRTSILEILEINGEITRLLAQKEVPNALQLEEVAKNNGLVTLYQAGLIKALKGETTLEELMRAI
jgi:type II secretory ATPase GspE/PulE/Tfp pilus assembly ATPase PilB-like protein